MSTDKRAFAAYVRHLINEEEGPLTCWVDGVPFVMQVIVKREGEAVPVITISQTQVRLSARCALYVNRGYDPGRRFDPLPTGKIAAAKAWIADLVDQHNRRGHRGN